MKEKKTYTIIKDTREQKGWEFEASTTFTTVENKALKTGDYTVKGFEDILCIERKRNTSEVYGNLYAEKDGRFERELERMRAFKHAFLIFEFTMGDVINFPLGSGIPLYKQKNVYLTGWALLKRFIELQMQYPYIHFIYAGKHGKDYALSLMKRVTEREEECQMNQI